MILPAAPLDPGRSAATALLLARALAASAQAQAAPERGVFITQIADNSRVTVTQRKFDSVAQIMQNGAGNEASARQDGDGWTGLVLAQEGDDNSAILLQRDIAGGMKTGAAVQQTGNGNQLELVQDGSDNQAELSQVGEDNTKTATQMGDGNRLLWAQNGDGLSDLQIQQTGNAALQITQNAAGAQFAPPPGTGG